MEPNCLCFALGLDLTSSYIDNSYIDNDVVEFSCLIRSGLHLNCKGDAFLTKNLNSHLHSI